MTNTSKSVAHTPSKAPRRYEDDLTLCYQVAHLYYVEDQPQWAIADLLSLSRPTIGKLLKTAKELGIVTMNVTDIAQTCHDLSANLAEVLGLSEAHVVPSSSVSVAATRRAIAARAASYLLAELRTGMTVGMGWGRTLYDLVTLVPATPPIDVEVVPLIGGTDQYESFFQTNEMVRVFAHKLGGKAAFLHGPAMLDSLELRQHLVSNHVIANSVAKWDRLDLAVVGIGLHPSPVARNFGPGTADLFQYVVGKPVSGDIVTNFYDLEGGVYKTPFADRMLCISPAQLQATRNVIGVGGGEAKEMAIVGAARAGFFKVLITDQRNAEQAIKLCR